jgi:hypothetical protein
MINGMGRMWKEVVVAWFKVLVWNLPGRTEKELEKPVSG